MFASLVFEREPPTLADLPGGFWHWLEVVGTLALFGILLWMLLGLPFMRRDERQRIPRWQSILFLVCLALAACFYLLFGIVWLFTARSVQGTETATGAPPGQVLRDVLMRIGAALALFAVCLPLLRNVLELRPRRIWALARLSFQEAIRRRALYAFCIPLIFFLFASWFISSKPEDQLRGYVGTVFPWMTIFLLLIAVVIASFSIPTDIRQQTIHTILTKPVERFEIILGRFLGFSALITMVLLVMTTLSLIFVVRGVDPEAAAESLKAREAIYGNLSFEGTARTERGDSVGREWDYRSYISAASLGRPAQVAIWSFTNFPKQLGEQATIPCEFNFDIYRTTKGDENIGVRCQLVFTSWRFHKGEEDAYRAERTRERSARKLSDVEIDNQLAEKYGYFEIPTMNITDYHTMTARVPGALFKNAEQADPTLKTEMTRRGQATGYVQVRIKCISPTQYLGMAKHDLYLRADDPANGQDRLRFAWNFYKGAFGLWLRLCLVTGLAVVLSTYLSGVIGMLTTAMLYLLGLCTAFIQEVALGKNVAGGPLEAGLRLIRRENLVAPLEETTTNRMAQRSDDYFRVFVRGLLNIIPDVESSNLVSYVAEGFNIGPERLLISAVMLFGYLLPWFLLGYYLMKWREIASST